MEYDVDKREIRIDKVLNELDALVIEFLRIFRKHVEYVVISGYVSILLGRSRMTEDVDLFFKRISFDVFFQLYHELKENSFWCLNAESPMEVFSYLQDGLAIRFAKEGTSVPNFEIKFPKREIDMETFTDYLTVILPNYKIKISSLERHVAFKRYYLKSDKDIEDSIFVEDLFPGKIDYSKVNKLKEIVSVIED
jgi:predicted nucleotidyltransferase